MIQDNAIIKSQSNVSLCKLKKHYPMKRNSLFCEFTVIYSLSQSGLPILQTDSYQDYCKLPDINKLRQILVDCIM